MKNSHRFADIHKTAITKTNCYALAVMPISEIYLLYISLYTHSYVYEIEKEKNDGYINECNDGTMKQKKTF